MDIFTIFMWSLTAITIFGTYLNSRQNKYGFLVWGLCNMLWLGVDFTRGIYAQAALYVVFIGFNVYGWIQWGKIYQSRSEQFLRWKNKQEIEKLLKRMHYFRSCKSHHDVYNISVDHDELEALIKILGKKQS